MDKDAELNQLESEKAQIEGFLDHPISQKILSNNEEAQQAFLSLLIDIPVVDVASLISHFEARGHLRGLRQAKVLIDEGLDEIKDKIKELNEQ